MIPFALDDEKIMSLSSSAKGPLTQSVDTIDEGRQNLKELIFFYLLHGAEVHLV